MSLTATRHEVIENPPNHAPEIIKTGKHQPPVNIVEHFVEHP